jgi:hypothetical protein
MRAIKATVRMAARLAAAGALLLIGGVIVNGTVGAVTDAKGPRAKSPVLSLANRGKQIFRFETFGDQGRRAPTP